MARLFWVQRSGSLIRRATVGNRRYGHVGTQMLPVKAFDTMQPLYGLTSIGLLIAYGQAGDDTVVGPVASVICGKIGLDPLFYLWSRVLYRRWVGPGAPTNLVTAVLAALIEPFTFQVLRHGGAILGWISFLTRQRRWGRQERAGLSTTACKAAPGGGVTRLDGGPQHAG
jgi:hypothetical protein